MKGLISQMRIKNDKSLNFYATYIRKEDKIFFSH